MVIVYFQTIALTYLFLQTTFGRPQMKVYRCRTIRPDQTEKGSNGKSLFSIEL